MSKRPQVLIIEDDDWMARSHERALANVGISSLIVPHALAAMDVLDTSLPDLIILDVLLPGPNAFTLLHELRSHVDLASIPVILCTNSADQFVGADMRAYGISRILDKTTMRPEDLVAAVKRALP